jgi:hypothetical protein
MRGRPTKDPHTRPAINTLERLHMELGGQILENRQRYEELSHQMRHVEAVIKMLDPAYNLARITVKRRQPNKWFMLTPIDQRAAPSYLLIDLSVGRPLIRANREGSLSSGQQRPERIVTIVLARLSFEQSTQRREQ